MREEWLNRIALTWANKTRPRQVRALLDRYESATEVVARFGEMVNYEAMEHARKELDFIERHNISTYFYKDTNYPYRLANCVDAPLILYAKGNVNMNAKHMVSIVGTRIPSDRGKDWCRRLILDLANQITDLTIISGLAYGIDVVAHRAAIEAEIPTIIVPAHGLDRIYPAAHRNVAIQALGKGGIVTEYTCGTEPERFNFVARNRIVAGLADALVVVESKKKGGSLITADMAMDYGRDVFTIPGRIDDECSAGCNDLIKHHKAQMIENAGDLIANMQWECQAKSVQTIITEILFELTPQQQRLYDILKEAEDGLHINQLVMEIQLGYNIVVSELVMMELQDVVKSMPGGMWKVKK
ncbi:MAG: DNA-processing protein DprA [Paludibacteraceae bacterium]|nr:DNA-processing protein DprA [Paludibacteraceae bacterium]